MPGSQRLPLPSRHGLFAALLTLLSVALCEGQARAHTGEPRAGRPVASEAIVAHTAAFSRPTAPASRSAPSLPSIATQPTRPSAPSTPSSSLRPAGSRRRAQPYPIMLGIDVLEAQGFPTVAGKRIGILTHPAGVNRSGLSTVDVLRRSPQTTVVTLFGPEHGIYGNEPAEIPIADRVDKRTALPVYSLYGKNRKPTKAMLRGLDALVVDLQDVGSRSYTYISCMRYAMEACFENGVEVIVLDRPNPLGGLKVDGPPLDAQWSSYVGAFPVPYVHGLTIGELARMAASTPGVMAVPDAVRQRGKLTVVPMRGWTRGMRWPETGLRWVPTSPYVPDFSSCVGYAMTGLGTYLGGFRHGVGDKYPFRGVSHLRVRSEVIEKELRALDLPGLAFRRVSVPNPRGEPSTGLYVEVTDWDDWRPTELSFHLMRLACKLETPNPFRAAPRGLQNGFLRHMGSTAFLTELQAKGSRVDVEGWIQRWQTAARTFQQQSRRYWLY